MLFPGVPGKGLAGINEIGRVARRGTRLSLKQTGQHFSL